MQMSWRAGTDIVVRTGMGAGWCVEGQGTRMLEYPKGQSAGTGVGHSCYAGTGTPTDTRLGWQLCGASEGIWFAAYRNAWHYAPTTQIPQGSAILDLRSLSVYCSLGLHRVTRSTVAWRLGHCPRNTDVAHSVAGGICGLNARAEGSWISGFALTRVCGKDKGPKIHYFWSQKTAMVAWFLSTQILGCPIQSGKHQS